MNPLVTIIVPIYNAEKYLKECVESILCQTYKELQIILVNDGSTDNSLDICSDFSKRDSRIELINQKNTGVSSARNLGIEASKGEYIYFIDSDDYLDYSTIEKLLNTIKLSNADICVLMKYTIKPVSPDIINCTKLGKCEAIRELFLLRFPSSLWAYLYKKEVLKDIRLNNDIHFFEDFEFNYRVLKNIDNIALSYDNLYYYRAHELSTNNQLFNKKRITCLQIFDLHKESINKSDCNIAPYSIFFRSHFIISVIINIIKSNNVDKKYITITKIKLKEMLYDAVFSKYVPISYKLLMISYLIKFPILKLIFSLRRRRL